MLHFLEPIMVVSNIVQDNDIILVQLRQLDPILGDDFNPYRVHCFNQSDWGLTPGT